MIYIMKNGGHDTYNIKQFTLDTPDDLPDLPTSGIAVGSAALVISTSDVYMLNSKGVWGLIASDAEGILPSYSAEDVGKILEVGEGGILAWAANNALPSVTSEDEGKVLKVDDQGEWVAAIDSNTQYTAGTNIQISEENVISATDTTYTAGSGIAISEQNVISNTAEGNTDIIAEEYDNAKSYAVGDYCVYDNKLYRCISAITPPYWYKIPIKFSDFLNFSNVSANPEDCYVTVQSNGHWIMASTAQNQTVRNIGFSQNYSLIYGYVGTASTGYYNGFDYYVPSVIAQYFPNGGYASESAALADLFSRPYFDSSKWTEITVTDEINEVMSAKADITSLATVATSGAYSDLSGKPTIDTALDDTSTNAVENRAVASEINSIKSDITVDGSASGDIATFVDGSDNPLKELEISIEAVQNGSGDPSPSNVRPISGFNAANVTRCGKNLLDIANVSLSVPSYYPGGWNDATRNSYGGLSIVKTYVQSGAGGFSMFLPKGTYTFSANANYAVRKYLHIGYNDDGNFVIIANSVIIGEASDINVSYTFTLPISTDVAIRPTIGGTDAPYDINYIQIEVGDTATDYEPYKGETIDIDWEDEAGTVYGATLDVKAGVLTVTHMAVDMGGLTWIRYNFDGVYAFFVNISERDSATPIMCESYKLVQAVPSGLNNYEIESNSNATYIYVRNDDYADGTAFKTAVTGQKIVYKLATPIEYNLTPQQINSLLSTNNIWVDCGSITELKYIRDLNLCINDIIARIEALEGGSSNRSLSLSPTLTKSLTSDSDTTEGILEGKTEETEEETKEEAQNRR